MKKTYGILLMVLVLIFVTFCSSCKDGNKLKEQDAEVITIYVCDFEEWSNDYFLDAIDRYNDNLEDGVEIVYELLDDSTYTYKVESSREAGKAPDIYMVSYSNLWQEVVNESITPLGGIFSDEFFADYTDKAVESTTLYDEIYAVPYCFEPSLLLFYSKSMFIKAGITDKDGNIDEPQTYQEMLDACAKLSNVIDKRRQTVLSTPIGLPMGWANVGQFYNAAGGNFPISDDWSTSLVATENMEGYVEFLDYYTKLYTLGYASRSDTAAGYNEIINELCEGRVAMTFAGSYAVGQIYQDYIGQGYLEDANDIGCCLAPRLNQELGATTNGGWSFVLDAATTSRIANANEKVQGKTHASLAADFLEWYVTDETVAPGFFELGKCSKQTGFKSVEKILDKTQIDNPFYDVIKEAVETAAPLNRYPYSITQAFTEMIETLTSTTNKKTIEQVIGTCHSQVQEQIDLNKLAGKNPSKSNK